MKIKTILKNIIKKLITSFNFTVTRSLNNQQIKVPIRSAVGVGNLFLDKHETWLNAVLKEYYKGKGIFIDVGANIGQTLIKFKSLHSKGRYLGFEPNPNCVSYLTHLIKLNNWDQVDLVSAGLGAENLILPMYFDDANPTSTQSGATFVKDYRKSTNKRVGLLLPCLKLDDFQIKLLDDAVELIKIDVEGGELFVLEGLIEIIRAHKPAIVVEILPAARENNNLRVDLKSKINHLIKGLDYEIHEIQEGHYSFSLLKLENIQLDKSELVNYNYLLLPKK